MGVDLNPRHFVVGGGALEVLKGVGQGANEHNLVFELVAVDGPVDRVEHLHKGHLWKHARRAVEDDLFTDSIRAGVASGGQGSLG